MFPDQSGRVYVTGSNFNPAYIGHWKKCLTEIEKLNIKPVAQLIFDQENDLVNWLVLDRTIEDNEALALAAHVEKLLALTFNDPVKDAEKLRIIRFFVHTEMLKKYVEQNAKMLTTIGDKFEEKYLLKMFSSMGDSPLSLPESYTNESKILEPKQSTLEQSLKSFDELVTTLQKSNNVAKLVELVNEFNPEFQYEKQTKKELAEMIAKNQLALVAV